jgi:hypothetical protein
VCVCVVHDTKEIAIGDYTRKHSVMRVGVGINKRSLHRGINMSGVLNYQWEYLKRIRRKNYKHEIHYT